MPTQPQAVDGPALAPTAPNPADVMRAESMYTGEGPLAIDKLLPQDDRAAFTTDMDRTADPKEARATIANQRYVSANYPDTKDLIDDHWASIRPQVAAGFGLRPDATDTDLYGAIGKHVADLQKTRAQVNQMQQDVQPQLMAGEDPASVTQAWLKAHPEVDGEHRDLVLQRGEQFAEYNKLSIAKYAPIVQSIQNAFELAQANPGSAEAGAARDHAVGQLFALTDPTEQGHVAQWAAQTMAKKPDERSKFGKAVDSLEAGAGELGTGTGAFFAKILGGTLQDKQAGVDSDFARFEQTKYTLEKAFNAVNSPVAPDAGLGTKTYYGFLNFLPKLPLIIAAPEVAAPAIFGQEHSEASSTLRQLGFDNKSAEGWAVPMAAANTVVSMFNAEMVGKSAVQGIEKAAIGSTQEAAINTLKRFGLHAGAMALASGGAEAINLGVPYLAGQLDDKLPKPQFTEQLKQFRDAAPGLILGALVVGAASAGLGVLHDASKWSQFIQEKSFWTALGYDKGAVDEITRAPTLTGKVEAAQAYKPTEAGSPDQKAAIEEWNKKLKAQGNASPRQAAIESTIDAQNNAAFRVRDADGKELAVVGSADQAAQIKARYDADNHPIAVGLRQLAQEIGGKPKAGEEAPPAEGEAKPGLAGRAFTDMTEGEQEGYLRKPQVEGGATAFKQPDGSYFVRAGDGEAIGHAPDAAAAHELVLTHDEANGPRRGQAVQAMIDHIRSFSEQGQTMVRTGQRKTLADAIASKEITHEDATAAILASGRLRTEEGLTPDKVSIGGENTSHTDAATGLMHDVSLIHETGNPLTPVHEHAHGYLKRRLADGSVTMDTVAQWHAAVTGEERPSDSALHEFFAEQAEHYLVGKVDDASIPATFKAWFHAMKEAMTAVIAHAAKLMQMERDGALPEDFQTHLKRAVGLDEEWNKDHAQAGTIGADTGDVNYSLAKAKREEPPLDGGLPNATFDDFKPGNVQHIMQKGNWAIVTAENPAAQKTTPKKNSARQAILKSELDRNGVLYRQVGGKYGNPEKPLLAVMLPEDQAMALAVKHGQESILTRKGLLYSDGTIQAATGITEHAKEPDDFFTHIPQTGALFTMNISDDRVPAKTFSLERMNEEWNKDHAQAGTIGADTGGVSYALDKERIPFNDTGGRFIKERENPEHGLRFKNPIPTVDGGRISGFSDSTQRSLTGYSKNGDLFTVRPADLVKATGGLVFDENHRSFATAKKLAAAIEGIGSPVPREFHSEDAPQYSLTKAKDDKPLPGSLGKGVLAVVHHSGSGDLRVIDPAKFGKSGTTPRSEMAGSPRTYWHLKDSAYEFPPQSRPWEYTQQVPKGRLYDTTKDPLGYYDMVNRWKADEMLKAKGFIGTYAEGGGYKNVQLYKATETGPAVMRKGAYKGGAGDAAFRANHDYATWKANFDKQKANYSLATPDDFTKEKVKDALTKDGWSILTAANPGNKELPPEENAARMEQLDAHLKGLGLNSEEAQGMYDRKEPSRLVYGVSPEEALAIGNKFGQESVLTRHGLIYGDGTVNPSTGIEVHDTPPENYYTTLPRTGTTFTVGIDFDQRLKQESEPSFSLGLKVLNDEVKPDDLPKHPTAFEVAKWFHDRAPEHFDYNTATPEQNAGMAEALTAEALRALDKHPEAAGWYNANLGTAMGILRKLDPAMGDRDHDFVFKAILAITSNGNAVGEQFDQAWATYQHWKETGDIKGDFAKGNSAPSIRIGLGKLMDLINQRGLDGANEWLSRKGTIRELRQAAQDDAGYSKKAASTLGGKELIDTKVPYAVIFGPKIGSFFNNLYGDYSSVTMDRWFMRTFGRLSGSQVMDVDVKGSAARLRRAVGDLTGKELSDLGVTKASLAGEGVDQAARDIYNGMFGPGGTKPTSERLKEVGRAAAQHFDNTEPMRELPQNGSRAEWLRERLEQAQGQLREKGINLANADLQALLWYSEKELYKKLGVKGGPGGPNDDYASAAESLHERVAGGPSGLITEGAGPVGEGDGGSGSASPVPDYSLSPVNHGQTALAPTPDSAARKLVSELGADKEFTPFKRVLNRFIGDNALTSMRIARQVEAITKEVPKVSRRQAITAWLQAGGDKDVLAGWTKDAKGSAAQKYQDAQTLTPNEVAVARGIREFYSGMLLKLQAAGIVDQGLEHYVNQLWKKPLAPEDPVRVNARLATDLRNAKQRTFGSYAEGEQAGYTPVTTDIAHLLAIYGTEAGKVMASRDLLRNLSDLKAKDGRPLVAPGGGVISGDGKEAKEGDPAFVKANLKPEDMLDYKPLEHPAFQGWKWAGESPSGDPIMLKGQLLAHPEAYQHLNNVFGQSWQQRWLNTPGGPALNLVKGTLKGLDILGKYAKGTSLGFLSPFHQVNLGGEALGHFVSPTGLKYGAFGARNLGPELMNPDNPTTQFWVHHGLMIAGDGEGMSHFMDSIDKNLVHKFVTTPLADSLRERGAEGAANLADLSKRYTQYLFHDYIPRLKIATAEQVQARNMELYKGELAAKTMTPDDVAYLTGKQVNAAYGHLNYADMGRDPTLQHFLRMTLLAPDFLEARARAVGGAVQGAASKVGREQLMAFLVIAGVQYSVARVANKVLDDDYHADDAFGIHSGDRVYTMRSIPEDVWRLASNVKDYAKGGDFPQFFKSRMSPLASAAQEIESGKNWRGEKMGAWETAADILGKFVPITLRGIPEYRQFLESGGGQNVSPIETTVGALGLQISRYSPITEAYKLAAAYKQAQDFPHAAVYPTSQYQQLRYALEDGDMNKAAAELTKLRAKEDDAKISKGLHAGLVMPWVDGSNGKPAKENTAAFKAGLNETQLKLVELAEERRQAIWQRFQDLKAGGVK